MTIPSSSEQNGTDQTEAEPAETYGLSQASLELLARAVEVFKDFPTRPGALHDLPQLTVEPGDLAQVCRLAKDDPRLGVKQLLCLACVDQREYFELVYILHSLDPEWTLAVKTSVPYDSPRIHSVTSVWRAAEWYEREAHDLFGVTFDGHPNLEPLLLYEGFEGFPGRKDFPFHEYQEF